MGCVCIVCVRVCVCEYVCVYLRPEQKELTAATIQELFDRGVMNGVCMHLCVCEYSSMHSSWPFAYVYTHIHTYIHTYER
jgi:hypothetical protein